MLRRNLWLATAIAAFLTPAAGQAQNAVITGVVRSETQSAVRGAFVSVQGIDGATAVTNDNGNYRIQVAAQFVRGQQVKLTVSSIGFRTTEVDLMLRAGTIQQDLTMSEQAISLDEVIVTGTAGRQERRAQSAVVSTVNAAKVAEVAPIQTVANLLQARTPGVVLTNNSGSSGTSSTIRIRGVSSINLSNDPLVFIDGIRMDGGSGNNAANVGGQSASRLNDIKLDDIESIEVVKGPAAATLYGSDANAGVINIITKRGRANSGFTQSITMEYGQANPNFTPPDNYSRCTASNLTSSSFPACAGLTAGTVLKDNPLVREGSFNDGRYRNLSWNLRGGGERYTVFLSTGIDDERGTLPNNDYGHLNGRANFDFFASEKLRMEFGFALFQTKTQLPRNDNDIYGYLGGGLLGDPRTQGAAKDGWYAPNRQTLSIAAYENVDRTLRVQPRVSTTYTPFSWFTNRFTAGGDVQRSRAYSFWAKNSTGWWDNPTLNTGQIGEVRDSEDRYTLDYLGNVTRNISNDLRADVSFGSQVIMIKTDATSATGTGLVNNDVRTVNSAAQLTGGGQNSSESRQVGFFAQTQFSFKDKLYLQVGARRDQASSFGADSKPFYSPKVGVSYVISDEPYFRNLFGENVFSTLRLRGAYGVTGRQPTSGARSTYSPSTNQISATAVVVGVVPGVVGNPELRAEKGHELELGFESGLLNDRLGFELTFFRKETKDLILSQPLPGSLGINNNNNLPSVNIGSMLNRGFEIAANARVLTYDNLALELRGAINTLHNEVLDLGGTPPTTTRKEGFPISGLWGYTIREVDVANNRVIVSDTQEFVGNGNQLPDYEGNFSTTLTVFRDLSFYAQADFRGGYWVYNNTEQFRDRQNGFSGLAVYGCGFFRADLDSANCTDEERTRYMRKFGPWVTENGGQTLSRTTVRGDYQEDASFARLREASVSYRVPRSVVTRYMHAQSAQLTVSFRNLRTWTDFTGLDPETGQFLTVPQDKRWTASFRFTF